MATKKTCKHIQDPALRRECERNYGKWGTRGNGRVGGGHDPNIDKPKKSRRRY